MTVNSGSRPPRLILVKHAQPILDASKAAREWRLGREGIAQAHRLAAALRPFAPNRLASSPEPKAVQTSEVLAGELALEPLVVDDLRELDRRVLPIMPLDEHAALNRRIFVEYEEPVLGAESARAALGRFERGLATVTNASDGGTLVIVSHGTVISLLVAAHNAVDPFELWQTLKCSSFVILDGSLALQEVVEIF